MNFQEKEEITTMNTIFGQPLDRSEPMQATLMDVKDCLDDLSEFLYRKELEAFFQTKQLLYRMVSGYVNHSGRYADIRLIIANAENMSNHACRLNSMQN